MNSNHSPIPSPYHTKLKEVCSNYRVLLLGLTGGIASGKSTVADLLEKKGAAMIDFDVLAREVVEPGKPAFRDILGYFGNKILQDDGRLDRKKLSKIVFQDPEKRKKLEGYTHPRIAEAFVEQVEAIAIKTPACIIQAVIPLLIETGRQGLFHRIAVVYAPKEKQIERLMTRDGISRKDAEKILDAQIPIDEKIRYADFIIYNDGPIDSTKKQIEALWRDLNRLLHKSFNRRGL